MKQKRPNAKIETSPKLKPKRLINGIIPTNKCNLKCEYCYISQLPDWMKMEQRFEYSPEHIAKCLSIERLGGACLINLTGEGETMLQPDLVKLCRLLLEQGHFMEIVTNFTVTKVIDEFLSLPSELQKHLEFKISFHYAELKRIGQLDRFWDNLNKLQASQFSFALELMPCDSLAPYIEDIKRLCKEHVGAYCHVTVGRTENVNDKRLLTQMNKEEYTKLWSQFNSKMFDFKMELLGVKRKEFCYAGRWSLFVNMHTGEARSCYAQPFSQNIFKNPEKPIRFVPVGCHCVQPYCFNGHAYLSLGMIPELETPTYADIRCRTREDGTEWFHPEAKEFFQAKLAESNDEYGAMKKTASYVAWYGRAAVFAISNPKTVLRYFRLLKLKRGKEKQLTDHQK